MLLSWLDVRGIVDSREGDNDETQAAPHSFGNKCTQCSIDDVSDVQSEAQPVPKDRMRPIREVSANQLSKLMAAWVERTPSNLEAPDLCMCGIAACSTASLHRGHLPTAIASHCLLSSRVCPRVSCCQPHTDHTADGMQTDIPSIQDRPMIKQPNPNNPFQ